VTGDAILFSAIGFNFKFLAFLAVDTGSLSIDADLPRLAGVRAGEPDANCE
jgi:hypothetical protein